MSPRKVVRITEPPNGLIYVPDFITEQEEAELLSRFGEIEFYDFVLQGVAAKRKVRHYGYSYEFYSPAVDPADPFPEWLISLRDRAAPIANLHPFQLAQALLAKYDPGAGIGWHRDAPAFGPTVVGISFGASETMRFRREFEDHFEMYKHELARRSLYVLSGAARAVWQHSLPPVQTQRYSITFRTVKENYRRDRPPRSATAS